MLFVCIIMHTPPNASSNTVNNTVIFIGIPAFLIMARPFDISNKYDINKPAVLLCEKCIIIFTMTEKSRRIRLMCREHPKRKREALKL